MKATIVLLIIVSFVPRINAETVTKNTFIQGSVEGSSGYVTLKIYNKGLIDENNPKYTCSVAIKDNGQFAFRDLNVSSISYFSIIYSNGKISRTTGVLLIEPNDKLTILFKVNKCLYAGAGAEKIDCLDSMNQCTWNSIAPSEEYNYNIIDSNYFFYRDKRVERLYSLKFDILRSYSAFLSRSAYELILTDNYYEMLLTQLQSFRFFYGIISNRKYLPEVIKYHRRNYDHFTIDSRYLEVLTKSRKVTEFIYLSEVVRKELESSEDSLGLFEFSFVDIYNQLSQKYQGDLLEKITTYAFLKLFNKKDSSRFLLEDALKKFKNRDYLEVLKKIRDTKSTGVNAFAFDLSDTTNRRFTSKEFYGKVVVMDFWFTNCRNCLILTKNMIPVVEHFQLDSDVVFVSVNVDSNRSIWMKGLTSGKYTHASSINLYTNGEGTNNELVKYYGYEGFPQLLLIDKQGKLISANPIKPSDDLSRKALIDLIERYR